MRTHPVLSFSILAIVPTWAVQFLFLAQGWDLMPALILELVFLLGAATLVTARTAGRAGVKALYAGAVRWRMGLGRFAAALLALPVLTLLVALASGSARTPAGGWAAEITGYLFLTLVFGAVLGNVWEETAWAGFAQARLMERHGLLRGSLLTAIPFALIHVPLAFAGDGPALTLTVLVVVAPVARWLYGTLLLDTGGSVLAVAVLHASFNASGQLGAVHGQWPVYVALALLVAVVALRRYARLDDLGYASAGSVSTLTR